MDSTEQQQVYSFSGHMRDYMEHAERAWNGTLDLAGGSAHPVYNRYEGACEIIPGILAFKGVAGYSVIDTGDGLVMFDSGKEIDAGRTLSEVRNWRPDTPLKVVIFSHHHEDHVGSVKPFDLEADARGWARPTVYAHENLPGHFDRYLKTLGRNASINRRQYPTDVPGYKWPTEYRYPDITFADGLAFKIGDLTFRLQGAKGETDDCVWAFIPERGVLFTGDLFIWALPNCGNPQKVQRYALGWAEALERMASCGARVLLPGHGFPIVGKDRIEEALTTTANVLREIETQVVAMMNNGWSLSRIIEEIKMPAAIGRKEYLHAAYDDPRFIVRNIWRYLGGSWDGAFDRLLPAPDEELGQEIALLAGGQERLVARARELSDAGRHALACHLIEAAYWNDQTDQATHEARTTIYRAHSAVQPSSMARNILNHAAEASISRRRDLTELS